uniref:Uncharacterized protein n=1 Tax=Clandestinovirus TaxID=2831644 RepID=A0A8F8KR86_9VIRU|nr:hypothetical protein KOM_12_426 [Clandestinovirus]
MDKMYKKRCAEFLVQHETFIDVWIMPHHSKEWNSLDGDIVAQAEMLNFLIAAYKDRKHYIHRYCITPNCTTWNGVFSVCTCGKTRLTWEGETRLKVNAMEFDEIAFPTKTKRSLSFSAY